jgi:hypothetical protein
MLVRFVGDVHGCGENTLLLSDTIPNVQVGDMNLYPYNTWWYWDRFAQKEVRDYKFVLEKDIYFVDGNHEHYPSLHPDWVKVQQVTEHVFYIPRGFLSGNVLFIGGGECIPTDRERRIEGKTIFSKEEIISEKQLNRIMHIAKHNYIEVIVSHVAPLSFVEQQMENKYYNNSEKRMDTILKKIKPKLWVHGHYHRNWVLNYDECQFICLAPGSIIDIDIPLADNFLDRSNYIMLE